MKNLLILLALLATACQSEHSGDAGAAVATDVAVNSKNTVVITMEGKTHELTDIDRENSKAESGDGEVALELVQSGNPVELSFNLRDPGIRDTGAAEYVLPDANQGDVRIGLNFKDGSRRGIAMNQRIMFTTGTIRIQQLTDHSLKMTFEGTGHPMVDQKSFPIEGSVDIAF